jgi:ArsR family transcriptional regulator, arsenate/arsenite/antimonite-responsive transcriptional repressor / arsenate reductase (thioredoxin)
MLAEAFVGVESRAATYRALGEPSRLAIADALALSDRTPGELRELLGLEWNLLGFHLRVLEDAAVVERRGSEGDRRRRYVRLRPGLLGRLQLSSEQPVVGSPLFVCTHNSARSQFAAALWRKTTGRSAWSAGSDPGVPPGGRTPRMRGCPHGGRAQVETSEEVL